MKKEKRIDAGLNMGSLEVRVSESSTARHLASCSQFSARSYLSYALAMKMSVLPLCVFRDILDRETTLLVIPEGFGSNLDFLSQLKFVVGTEIEIDEASRLTIDKAIYLAYKNASVNGEKVADTLQEIVLAAHANEASDVHFLPNETSVEIYFRINGGIVDISKICPGLSILKEHYENFVRHLKVLSNLDLTEHQLAQEGLFELFVSKVRQRVRLSVLPTKQGSSVSFRLVGSTGFSISSEAPLDSFNIPSRQRQILDRALSASSGLVVFCGPTGSGKSTMLQACLIHLRDKGQRIVSLEDPVEKNISGISQVEVDLSLGQNYMNFLPTALRQDPDVIAVGELRDKASASLVVEAGVTGHLVLTSMHSSSSFATLARLRGFQVPVPQLQASLHTLVNQRLVALNCEYCRSRAPVDCAVWDFFQISTSVDLYLSEGCECCQGSGTGGRTAIFEILGPEDLSQALSYRGAMPVEQKSLSFFNALREMLVAGLVSPKTACNVLGLGDLIAREARLELDRLSLPDNVLGSSD